MKNPNRVAELLAELRELAESDFELIVIDRCEKDLTAPPTVEIIDEEHQRFNGVVFNRVQSGHFNKTLSIHRALWSYFYGDIPDNCHIHHTDGNPANNTLNNLQLLTNEDHKRYHSTFEKTTTYICEHCGREYVNKVSGRHRFCSEKCQSAHYYRNYTEERVCQICGKIFTANKWRGQRFCSPHCAGVYSSEKRLGKTIDKKYCARCGKELTGDKRKQKFCSRHCAMEYRHKKD